MIDAHSPRCRRRVFPARYDARRNRPMAAVSEPMKRPLCSTPPAPLRSPKIVPLTHRNLLPRPTISRKRSGSPARTVVSTSCRCFTSTGWSLISRSVLAKLSAEGSNQVSLGERHNLSLRSRARGASASAVSSVPIRPPFGVSPRVKASSEWGTRSIEECRGSVGNGAGCRFPRSAL